MIKPRAVPVDFSGMQRLAVLLLLLASGFVQAAQAPRRRISISTSTPAATAPSSRTSPSPAMASIWSRRPTTRRSASGTGRPARRIRTLRGFVGPGNDGKIFAVAVSPDGKTIAAGGYFGAGMGDKPPYGDIRLFDFATGKVKAALKAPDYAIYDLAFSPDGTFLAAGGQDGFVYIWQRDEADATGWKPFTKLDADSWHIQQLAFADGGKKLVATTTDNGIRLWDSLDGTEIAMPDAEPLRDQPVMALAVSADGALFATGSNDGTVELRKAADGTLVRAMPKQDFLIGSLTFAAGGDAARRLLRLSLRRQAPHRRLDGRRRPAGAAISRP